MKKIVIMIIAVLSLNVCSSYANKIYATKSNETLVNKQVILASAQELYPLKDGEVLLDESILSTDEVEIFTKNQNIYYKKILKKTYGSWIELESQVAKLPYAGLKDDNNLTRDYSVEKALENKLKANGVDLNQLPVKLDYSGSAYFPPIGTQYEGSCVAWATGYYLRTYQQAKDIGWKVGNDTKHIFSPSFIYNQINEGVDEGSTLQDAGDLLKNIGEVSLYDFPYVPKDYTTKPSPLVIEKAAPNKIRDWYTLYTKYDSYDYIITKTKEYLNTGDLPVAGINVGFKWQYPLIQADGTSIVTTEKYILGGHAVVVVGYDDTLQTPEGYGAFKIINSYGTDWGQNGFTYMTYSAFAKAVTSGFVFTDLINGKAIDEMGTVNATVIGENTIKFSWDGTTNAMGYKVFDENLKEISTVYKNEYIEKVDSLKYVKRYFQAFNNTASSNVVSSEIDLNNIVIENAGVTIEDTVEFQMNFLGSGRYDFRVIDLSGNLILEKLNNQGSSGLNLFRWDGKDTTGAVAENGNYKLKITPYIGLNPGDVFTSSFEKKSKLVNANAKIYKYLGNAYQVEINLKAIESGKVTIYAVTGVVEVPIVIDSIINSGEEKTFKIDSSKININDKNMKIKVVVVD